MCERRSVRICCHDSPHDEAVRPSLRTFHTASKEEFSEVRGSKVDFEVALRGDRGGATRGVRHKLAPRWPHLWRGIVASGYRLLRSNFLGILGTPLGRVATDYGPSEVRPEGALHLKSQLTQKPQKRRVLLWSPSRQRRFGCSCLLRRGLGWAWPLVTLARRDEGHARHFSGDGAVDRRMRQGAGSRVGGLFLLAFISPTGALQALQALHKYSRLHRNYKV
jgi:hypothetical protein